MRLLYFSTVGFFYFYFFFQSPSRLDLTSDCHNQYQYRKVVEVAVSGVFRISEGGGRYVEVVGCGEGSGEEKN